MKDLIISTLAFVGNIAISMGAAMTFGALIAYKLELNNGLAMGLAFFVVVVIRIIEEIDAGRKNGKSNIERENETEIVSKM